MKILFMNNYPMDTAWKLWIAGEYPSHHLWGVAELPQHGVQVDILPFEGMSFLKNTRWRWRFGDIDQQARILLRRSPYDLLYSAYQESTSLLAHLKKKGLYKKPIVSVLHKPLPRSPESIEYINQHERLICLSQTIKLQMEDQFAIAGDKLVTLEWGVDLNFYPPGDTLERVSPEYIFSAGKTSRDYQTLVAAFQGNDYPLFISCDKSSAPLIPPSSSRIAIRSQFTDDKSLQTDYMRAYAVAIPLSIPKTYTTTLIGLTSLLEAMAMGKAVIMTRNRQIDIDIEKENIGIWVEPEDVQGWRTAIDHLLAHPEETRQMGKKARQLCDARYNMTNFSARLADILKRAAQESGAD